MNSKVGKSGVLYVKNISKTTQAIPKIIVRLIKRLLDENDFASDLMMKKPESTFLMHVET